MVKQIEKLRDLFEGGKILGADAGLFLEWYAKLCDTEDFFLLILNRSKEAGNDGDGFCNAITEARAILDKFLPFGFVEMVNDWEFDPDAMDFEGYALDQTRRELQDDVRRLLDDNVKLKERIRELTK